MATRALVLSPYSTYSCAKFSLWLMCSFCFIFVRQLLCKVSNSLSISSRGPIDKISTVYCQNPTFASTWQNKSESKEGRENLERQQTLPPRVCFSSPNRQYHPILIMPLLCRNYPSTSCRLYNLSIQPQGGICSAWNCIPWFFTQGLIKLNFGISSSTMNVNYLSINLFLLLMIEWPSVYY